MLDDRVSDENGSESRRVVLIKVRRDRGVSLSLPATFCVPVQHDPLAFVESPARDPCVSKRLSTLNDETSKDADNDVRNRD